MARRRAFTTTATRAARRHHRTFALLCKLFAALAGSVSPQLAHAEELETSRLSYSVHADNAACPDEVSFRNLVAARLGYDPFVAAGKHQTIVELVERNKKLRGRAEVTRLGSATSGVRELVVNDNECVGLATALATAVAIALDPVRQQQMMSAQAVTPTTPPPTTPPPTTPPPATSPKITEATPPARESSPRAVAPEKPIEQERIPLVPIIRGTGVLSTGVAPTFSVGGELGIGFRHRWFSLEATGRVESTPGSTRVASGDRLEATISTGGLLACAEHGSGLMGCIVARVGALQGRAPDVVKPELGSSLYSALGVRAGYNLKLSRALALHAAVEGSPQLVRTSLKIDGKAVWTAPAVAGGFSLGVILSLE